MKRILILVSALLAALSCGPKEKPVPFKEAQNYYFRNDATAPEDVKITDQATFESYFGMAAVMGRNGLPTSIDWDNEFVIAVVMPEATVETEIKASSLTKEKDSLVLRYQIKSGPLQLSYTIRPFLLIIVDRYWVNYPVRLTEMKPFRVP